MAGSITFNQRIARVVPMRSPRALMSALPLGEGSARAIAAARTRIADILHGRDDRLLIVVGPCSIHDPDAALEYAARLMPLREALADSLEIVMRVYFEKPRTTVGWKGLVNDPHLDGSYAIDEGLHRARRLLLTLAEQGMPAACEFLDAVTGQYYADLVSWGAIGARTTESQVHREIASGLSCPVGFKNGTTGDVKIAVDAMVSAASPHAFLSPTLDGVVALHHTTGNDDTHLILRGGRTPNLDRASVAAAAAMQSASGIDRRIMIDCSHANSGRDAARQPGIARDVARRWRDGESIIGGLMIESHLVAGQQKIDAAATMTYGQSVTDACIGWEETAALLEALAEPA